MIHPLVRDLYKRIVLVGRDYPLGLDWVKSKAKPWFRQNSKLEGDEEAAIKKCVAVGRYQVKEMQAVIQLKKYRHLRQAYYSPASSSAAEEAIDSVNQPPTPSSLSPSPPKQQS